MSSYACSTGVSDLPGSKAEINLLLVDDEGNFAKLLSNGLEKIDNTLNTHTATTPENALDKINTKPIDCVLSDYKMDTLTGMHLLRVVRELHDELPFILYTSHGDEALASKAISAGATEYVSKKVGADHYEYIATLIHSAVKQHYESKIQSRRQQLAQLTEARGNTGGFEVDTTNDLVVITRGATDILNPHNDEILALNEFYTLFNEENKTIIEETIDTVLDEEQNTSETIHRTNDNNTGQTLKITFVTTDSNTHTPNIRGIIKDVTDKIQRENQMEVFDRVLRHNIRNDLNLIHGHAEMIAQTASEDVTEHGKKVMEESDQLLESVAKQRDIMELLRNDTTYENLDLPRELRRIHEDIHDKYSHADISIKTDSTIKIYTSNRLPNAIKELIENAVQHNTVRDPQVTVKAKQTKQKLKIHVADNAEPIPEMERGVLLKPGERTPLYHGSGLGLWLIKLIIRECGGTINFDENEPHGNIIKLTIPR